MLLCFLAYVIATLTSYTVQFMNCLHCLLDKTMWKQQFGWLATTPKFKGILTIGWWKRWSSIYMTPLCANYQTAHFEIRSNCLFCGNSDKNYGEKGGYQLILVRIFNFQSMPSVSWRHTIKGMTNGSVVSIQEWHIFKTSMPRFMFTIFATTNKYSINSCLMLTWKEKVWKLASVLVHRE